MHTLSLLPSLRRLTWAALTDLPPTEASTLDKASVSDCLLNKEPFRHSACAKSDQHTARVSSTGTIENTDEMSVYMNTSTASGLINTSSRSQQGQYLCCCCCSMATGATSNSFVRTPQRHAFCEPQCSHQRPSSNRTFLCG